MVWIHGGAFVIGAGSQGVYNGKVLAARDAVIVTINYRLGAFGFLDLSGASDGRAPGTGAEGLADQILALHWVKENISQFGGDPGNVTIFGESAGGMSVGALLAAPPARGLFHKAIAQSGAAHIGYDEERSARVGRAMLDLLDIAPENAERAVDVPYGAIIRAQIAVLADSRDGHDTRKLGRLPFQPAIDGGVLAQKPIDAVREGSARGIPVMSGTTMEEWKLFTAANPRLRMMSDEKFQRAHRASGGRGSTRNARRLRRRLAIRALQRGDDGQGIHHARHQAARSAKQTCACLRLSLRLALADSGRDYGFVPCAGTGLRVRHLSRKTGGRVLRHGTGGGRAFQRDDRCVGFVCTKRQSDGWQAYDAPARATMIFGDGPPHVIDAPNEARRAAWEKLPERRLGP